MSIGNYYMQGNIYGVFANEKLEGDVDINKVFKSKESASFFFFCGKNLVC